MAKFPSKKKKKLSSVNHRPISATDTNQQKKPLGSFVTFGNRRSLRVAMKKNKRILRKIWICSDVLMDILPFFGRRQLGLKLALISPRFEVLVDKHFDGKSEWTIWRTIKIGKMRKTAKLFVEKSYGKSKQFPLPDHSLPNKIRFKDLRIEYIDHSVVTFLRSNQKIFDKGISLDLLMSLSDDDQPIWNAFAREIWPIFAPNIRHFNFTDRRYLKILRRHTSPTVLTDLNIMSIHFDDLLPAAIAKDGPKATSGKALSKWLQTPTKDGQPKQLSCRDYAHISETKVWVNNFKEAFIRATTPSANYIIRLDVYASTPIVPFELTNERTNEKLTLEKKEKDDANRKKKDDGEYVDFVVKRCQIGKTIQWEDKKTDNLNKITFELFGEFNIGPLSPPKAGKMNTNDHLKMSAGPSGQQQK